MKKIKLLDQLLERIDPDELHSLECFTDKKLAKYIKNWEKQKADEEIRNWENGKRKRDEEILNLLEIIKNSKSEEVK